MQVSTLRPGLLVILTTSSRGNVKYDKRTTERAHILENGQTERASWETTRTINDVDELDRAQKTLTKARGLITAICAWSKFGLLCPEEKIPDFEKAAEEAQRLASDFNRTSRITRIDVSIFPCRVEPNDAKAIRAINKEVRDLMEEMQRGVKALDPKAIRDAADKARSLGTMLQSGAQLRITEAIDAARKAANAAAKAARAGNLAAQVVDAIALKRLETARTAFLDMDDQGQIETPDDMSGRAVDLGDISEPEGTEAEAKAQTDAELATLQAKQPELEF